MRRCLLLLFCVAVLAFPCLAADSVFDAYRGKGIVVAQEADMAPMSFTGHNGEPKGYIIDLWRKWSDETGVPVRFHLVDWADTLIAVRDGKADVHGGLYLTPDRDKFLDYSPPFFPTRGALFVKADSTITHSDELNGQPVGVITGGYYQEFQRRTYPDMKPVLVKTAEGLVNAAMQDEVVAFWADYPTLMYQIGSMGKVKEFKTVQFLKGRQFRAAVAEGNAELLAMVEKGLERIDQSERDVILNRWIVSDPAPGRTWLLPVIIISVCSLLLAILVPFFFGMFRR